MTSMVWHTEENPFTTVLLGSLIFYRRTHPVHALAYHIAVILFIIQFRERDTYSMGVGNTHICSA